LVARSDTMEVNRIIQGDVLAVLKTLPDESIDCCITSPPYYGLRDYGTASWEGGDEECEHTIPETEKDPKNPNAGSHISRFNKTECYKCGAKRIDQQLGLEKTPEEYVAKMVEVFREVRRVLKREGTVWCNLGDSYATHASGGKGYAHNFRVAEIAEKEGIDQPKPTAKSIGLKEKDLIGIPWRVAFALQADGWYLRSDIIWNKPNPMPESVTDRPTKSFEHIFLLAKSPKYFYDAESIKEPATGFDGRKDTMYHGGPKDMAGDKHERWKRKNDGTDYGGNGTGFQNHSGYNNLENPYVRNKRDVWTISTKPFSEAHFATFPEDLVVPMIKAGVPEFVCKKCDKGREPILENTQKQHSIGATSGQYWKVRDFTGDNTVRNMSVKVGLTDCGCAAGFEPGIVLDIFMGAGTTALVAKKLRRSWLGIELNEDYCKMARNRIDSITSPML
jgi:DNA modification methylase